MRFVTLLTMLAWVQLIILRVILLLLPTVTLLASILIGTAVLIVIDKLSGSPVHALIFRINVELGLSSEVLPIMCKNALISLVVVFIVWAPNCLEMKHVEV